MEQYISDRIQEGTQYGLKTSTLYLDFYGWHKDNYPTNKIPVQNTFRKYMKNRLVYDKIRQTKDDKGSWGFKNIAFKPEPDVQMEDIAECNL